MSNEFIERLNSGSLTQIDQCSQMNMNLAPAAARLAKGAAVGDDWEGWELAPEWTEDNRQEQRGDDRLIVGADADKLRSAINILERDD